MLYRGQLIGFVSDGDIIAEVQDEIGGTAKTNDTINGKVLSITEGSVVDGVINTTRWNALIIRQKASQQAKFRKKNPKFVSCRSAKWKSPRDCSLRRFDSRR